MSIVLKNHSILKKILPCLLVCLLITLGRAQENLGYKKVDTLDLLMKKSQELRIANKMYEALELASHAATYAHDLNHNHYLSYSYFVMGTIQYEIIDYENAKIHFLRALEFSENTESKILLPYILQSLANLYYDADKDYENALIYYKRGVELGRGNVPANNFIIPLTNLIWTYMDLDRFDEAYVYLKEADSIARIVPDSVQLGKSTLYLARARNYAHLGDLKQAEENFEKMFHVLDTEEVLWYKGKSYFYQYRAKMYEDFKDYPKAIADLKKFRESEKVVFENARIKNEETANIQFKVNQYQQELAAAEREKLLLKNIDKNNKIIIYISYIAILLLGGVVFFYYRGYRSKKRSNKILESKNIELQQANAKEEKLSQIKSQFISTISHELRTPLYGIIGISSIFSENKNHSENDKKLLKSLKFSADYLLNLVNKVLTISKIDSGHVALSKSSTNLKGLSKNILGSFEYQSEEKGIQIRLEYDPKIPEDLLMDSLRVSEILINLIGNAIKFTKNGTIWLRVHLLDRTSEIARIRFEVEDTGIGIPEDQKEMIFDEFAQIGSLYDNKQGTGLGLSIVKNLLQLMGSKIYCESEKEKGSRFWFDLSADIPTHNIDLEKPTDLNPKNDQSLSASILLVEDNKINQLVTNNLLKHIGCSCTIVEHGKKAVDILKKQSFDLVLMDLNMPVMDGMNATLLIREFNNNTPIIALTASELSEVREDCLQAGMNDLVNKPLNKENLRDVIKRHLS